MLAQMTHERTQTPSCPSCGKPMLLARIIPGIGGLPELRVYSCRQCGVSLTEAAEPGEPALTYRHETA